MTDFTKNSVKYHFLRIKNEYLRLKVTHTFF